MKISLYLCLIYLLIGCASNPSQQAATTQQEEPPKKQRPIALEGGKFFTVGDRQMLYGGKDSTMHFDITGYELKDEQFHYGIGRERFPALLEPEFISVPDADVVWPDSARFLVAYAGDEVKAYSVKDLTRHEVVNDQLNGKPIMAAYCILADLGAIYDRQYGDKVLTFALSGYTYFDPEVWNGLDGFIMWDRETESLWWPLIGRAVSGPLKGVKMLETSRTNWEDTTWEKVKQAYPNAKVLKSGQDFDRPTSWARYEEVSDIVETFSAQ